TGTLDISGESGGETARRMASRSSPPRLIASCTGLGTLAGGPACRRRHGLRPIECLFDRDQPHTREARAGVWSRSNRRGETSFILGFSGAGPCCNEPRFQVILEQKLRSSEYASRSAGPHPCRDGACRSDGRAHAL